MEVLLSKNAILVALNLQSLERERERERLKMKNAEEFLFYFGGPVLSWSFITRRYQLLGGILIIRHAS